MADSPRTGAQMWADLLEGNRRFVENRPQPRDLVAERAAVATRQSPKAIVLACADSRVAPEIVFDQKLGDLFVLRRAANVADAPDLGLVELAVKELAVPLLVVMGHTHCAGIATAASGAKFESPNLKAMARRLRAACDQARGEGEQFLRNVERLNVTLSARDLLDRSAMLHDCVSRGVLVVVPAYYDFSTGEVTRLRPETT